jgi:hypothetical protein
LATKARFSPVNGATSGGRKKAAFSQFALHRDERHENDARGTQISETGKIVLPVRIDGNRVGQNFRRLMMIEYDWVEAEPCRLGERHMAHRPAIHRDQELRARACQVLDRLHIRTVAFENTVGDMD